jgi:hypothetical protein
MEDARQRQRGGGGNGTKQRTSHHPFDFVEGAMERHHPMNAETKT